MTTERLSASVISAPRGNVYSAGTVLRPEPHLLPWRPVQPAARASDIGGKFPTGSELFGEGGKKDG